MKAKIFCPECKCNVTVERFCKLLDDGCKNVEDGSFQDKPWCNRCLRDEGPMKSKAQIAEIKEKKKQMEELRISGKCKCDKFTSERITNINTGCDTRDIYNECIDCGRTWRTMSRYWGESYDGDYNLGA